MQRFVYSKIKLTIYKIINIYNIKKTNNRKIIKLVKKI